MHILCKLKEKADRGKKARTLFSNHTKIKNFIIEFEMNGRTIYDRVASKYISSLIELFYKNYLDVIISNFNFLGLNTKYISYSSVSLDYDKRYPGAKRMFDTALKLCSSLEMHCGKANNHHGTKINPVYDNNVELDIMSFINSYPNFSLAFTSIDYEINDSIQILYKIKETFAYKKVEDIYSYVLDVFIETLQKKKEESDRDLILSIFDLWVIIYYNFRIIFLHNDPETAILSFKEIGWSWDIMLQRGTKKPGIYVFKSIHESESILEEIFDRVEKERSVTREYIWHSIMYILYQFAANIVMVARKEYNKTLNEIFFNDFVQIISDHMPYLHQNYNRKHFILIPKDTSKLSLSSKQKSILLFVKNLFSIAKNESNYQKVKNKLDEIANQILSGKKVPYMFLFIMTTIPVLR